MIQSHNKFEIIIVVKQNLKAYLNMFILIILRASNNYFGKKMHVKCKIGLLRFNILLFNIL